ncbi:hypothetical protein CK203_002028 [Vitis vinifera]|uniref:Uncharacterized protein n=1 Tax=Vitis vinifera TaxID=29760 RepID=A0A438KKB8_VITVI|nr:hypothetical protein CK203_002028 [Vitis vinifera]
MGSDVVFSSLYLDRSDSVVFGLPGSFMDPHGLARPSLTGCSSRRGHDRLSYGASEIHPAGSALLDTWIPSCLSTWEVACAMMDDFMTFVLRTCHTPDAILGHISVLGEIYGSSQRGHISVRMRFTDHEGVACLALFGEISPLVYMIIHGYEIHARSMFDLILFGYSEEPLLSHSARFIPFDIVVWSCFWCLDFPRHHFRGIRSVTRPIGVILGSSGQIGYIRCHIGASPTSHHHYFSQFRRSERPSVFRSTFRVASSVSAFRVVITSQFDIQSHHHHFSQFRCSEPPSVFRSTFRVAFSVSAFRVVITSQIRCSEPSSLLLSVSAFRAAIGFQIDVQSRVLGFGVQSRYHFSASDVQSHHHHYFSQFQRSEPSSIFRLTFRVASSSYHRFSDRHSESHPRFRRLESLSLLSLTFRVIIITSQFRRSELSSVFRSTFRVASSVSAFRVVITSQFDVQSHHHHFSVSAFRAIIAFQFGVQSHHRLPEPFPSSCFVLASRAITVILFKLLGLLPSSSVFRSFYFLSLVLRVGLVIQSHNSWRSYPLALHILPSGSCIRPRLSSLRYPVFIAYSSRTPRWFDRYSSLTLISWVTFGDILERVCILGAGFLGQRGNSSGRLSRGQGTGWLAEERGEKEKRKNREKESRVDFSGKKKPGGKRGGRGYQLKLGGRNVLKSVSGMSPWCLPHVFFLTVTGFKSSLILPPEHCHSISLYIELH